MSGADGPDGPAEQSRSPQRSQSYPYHEIRQAILHSYINVLWVFVPIGIVSGALRWHPVAVFFLNFLAIIPLSPSIIVSIRALSAGLGHVLGGLLYAILSNAVEMIVRYLCLSVIL